MNRWNRPGPGSSIDPSTIKGNNAMGDQVVELVEKKEPTFEQALARLEEVVRRLESGQLPLDESLGLFQEGVGMARICERLLDQTQAKIEILIRKDGETRIESFEEAE